MKKIIYFVFANNRIIRFISSPAVSMIIPPLVVLYYGTLDIWGDDWLWIKENKGLHETIFTFLALGTIIILFLKSISESIKGAVTKKYQELIESMIFLFNDLVKKKKDRFYKKAKHLKPNGDVFKAITHPKDQLQHILDGTKKFIEKGFDIDRNNISITIIKGNEAEDKWWFEIKCDTQRQHSKAKELMTGNSTAKYCYDSGDSLFIPDIRKGVKENLFYESERSKKTSIGSIFCKPVRITVGDDAKYVYIFTIAVFGQHLCTTYDEDECKACEKILDEVADRVELELYLYSMRDFKS